MGIKNQLTSRQAKYGLNTTLYVLAAVAILVILNLLAVKAPTRLGEFSTNWQWDLTASKRYSLSQQTDQILAKLDQDIQLIYFDRRANFASARELLEQFPLLSRRVSVSYVDVDSEPAKAAQYNVKEYGKIVVATSTKSEATPANEEEDITNTIIRVLREGPKTLCFLIGHGERTVDDGERLGYSGAKTALEEGNYKIEPLSLQVQEPEVPASCTVVVVAGPSKDMLDPEIEALKRYMIMGGRVMFLLTPHTPPKFVTLLSEFGADVSNTRVIDVSGVGMLFGADATMPLVRQYENHPITKDLTNIPTLFPTATAVQSSVGFMPGADFALIARTAPESFATRNVNANEVRFEEGKDLQGPIALVGAGTFHDPGAPAAIETRYVVMGSPDVASNYGLEAFGNRDLFLNAMAWLSSDEDLIAIRPKDPEERPVELSPTQLAMVRIGAYGVVPLAVIIVGLGVWWRRRG
jgi:ABC-type uncharacterized transport system involved in gliding motility auxiliary subunit